MAHFENQGDRPFATTVHAIVDDDVTDHFFSAEIEEDPGILLRSRVKAKSRYIPVDDVGWIGRSPVSTADRDDGASGKVGNDPAIEFCHNQRGGGDYDGEP